MVAGWSYLTPESVLFKNPSNFDFSVFLFIACFSLGLCDDLSVGGLRPKFRLVALCSVYDIVLSGVPESTPSSLWMAPLDSVTSLPLLGLAAYREQRLVWRALAADFALHHYSVPPA